jgi:hypothetical protein
MQPERIKNATTSHLQPLEYSQNLPIYLIIYPERRYVLELSNESILFEHIHCLVWVRIGDCRLDLDVRP